MHYNGVAVSTVTLCVLLRCMPTSAAFGQEAPTLKEVIDGIERTEQLLFKNKSLLIRCERTKSRNIEKPGPSPIALAEWTLASKGNKWYFETRFTEPQVKGDLVIPARSTVLVIKDGVIVEWEQDSEQAFVRPFDLGSNSFSGLYFTSNLSIDAPRYIVDSNGANLSAVREYWPDQVGLPFLPEFLRQNQGSYHVGPVREKVDGVDCWLVEWPGMDRFFVAPQLGFAIPRREYCFGLGKPLKIGFHHRDYREVRPGLWLPFSQTENRYCPLSEPAALWGKVASESEYQLNAIEFDNVPDSLFDIKLPQGTVVYDRVRDFSYSVSDASQDDPFNAAIAEARKRGSAFTLRRLLLFVGGVVVILMIVTYLYRFRRDRMKSG